ncbi:MAG: PDZ domain-containing protein, partial [Candidatus Methylomirabilales bacterium]
AAGLAPGDVIVAADGKPVASASDLQVRAAAAPAGGTLTLDVRGRDGSTRQVKLPVIEMPNPLRLGNRTPVYNKAILEMREALQTADNPLEQAVARLNLAIAHVSLHDWEEALDLLGGNRAAEPPAPFKEHDLKALLRGGCTDEEIASFIVQAVWRKEPGHRIGHPDFVKPARTMSAIGG